MKAWKTAKSPRCCRVMPSQRFEMPPEDGAIFLFYSHLVVRIHMVCPKNSALGLFTDLYTYVQNNNPGDTQGDSGNTANNE